MEPTKYYRLLQTRVDMGDYFLEFDTNQFMSTAKIKYKENAVGQDREILFSNKHIDRVMEIADLLDYVQDTDEEGSLQNELENLIGI